MERPTNKISEAFVDNSTIHHENLREIANGSRLYVIFIIARSGSTWLMEMAENSSSLGTPQEWFNEGWIHTRETALGCRPPQLVGTLNVDEYIERTVLDYRSEDGVMGTQLSVYQTQCLCEMLESPEQALQLVTPFYLRRRDVVAQAISLYRSVNSGVFHSYQEGSIPLSRLDDVTYDADAIAQWCDHLVDGEIYFEAMFRKLGVRPFRFMYEDLVSDPAGVLTYIRRVIDPSTAYLLAARSNKVKLLSKATSKEWNLRFLAEESEFLANLERRRPALKSNFLGEAA